MTNKDVNRFKPLESRKRQKFTVFRNGTSKRADLLKGFTLFEQMMVIFIFSIIMVAIFGILSVGRQSSYTGGTQVELQQETRKAMDWMVKELRQCQLSLNIVPPIQHPFPNQDVIFFQIPADYDGDGTVLDNTTGNIEWGNGQIKDYNLAYTIDGTQLLRIRTDDTGIPIIESSVLANNITAISFNSVSSSVINIGITAQKNTIQGRTIQSSLNSQVTLRN